MVVEGGPSLGDGTLSERRERFRREHDGFRRAVVNEPRGSDVLVGALLCAPMNPDAVAGVIFFNNVGFLGMCGHGTIGLVATLSHLGRLGTGAHRIETPVGMVDVRLHENGSVTFRNVASYRTLARVAVDVEGHGSIVGDVAWGGNWFFLVEESPIELLPENVERLTDFAWRIRQALSRGRITGTDGADIDHVELSGPSRTRGIDSRNFVLCPGRAYDRSPCGTGTSAKLACLVADGRLREGDIWREESIVGSIFEGRVEVRDGRTFPSITGSAYVTAESELLLDERDPFCCGISP